MDIKCRKTSCIYNNKYNCSAKEIKINEDNLCATFQQGSEKKDYSKDMFESANEYGNSQHIKDKKLVCDCKNCLFNKKNKCDANGITIIDDNNVGACATFIYDEK